MVFTRICEEGWILFNLEDLHDERDFRDPLAHLDSDQLIRRYLKPSNSTGGDSAPSNAGEQQHADHLEAKARFGIL